MATPGQTAVAGAMAGTPRPMPGQHQDYVSPAFQQRMMGQKPTPQPYQRPPPDEHMDNFSPAFFDRLMGQTPHPPAYQRPMPGEHMDNFSDAFMQRMTNRNRGLTPGPQPQPQAAQIAPGTPGGPVIPPLQLHPAGAPGPVGGVGHPLTQNPGDAHYINPNTTPFAGQPQPARPVPHWVPPRDMAFGAMKDGRPADWQPRGPAPQNVPGQWQMPSTPFAAMKGGQPTESYVRPNTQTYQMGSKQALHAMMGFQGPINRLGH
jgi:hypothetical protein